jgi:hypothetical protein
MKTILTALAICLCLSGQSQEDSTARWILSNKDQMENHMKASGDFVTQFCNMELNFVDMRVQDYMSMQGYLQQSDLMKFNMIGPNKYIQEVYISKSSQSLNPHKIFVKYNVKPLNDHEFYITSCEIFGFSVYVINFFIGFWPRALNFDDCKKKEIVYYTFLFDRIGLYVDLVKNTAKIKIQKSTQIIDQHPIVK